MLAYMLTYQHSHPKKALDHPRREGRDDEAGGSLKNGPRRSSLPALAVWLVHHRRARNPRTHRDLVPVIGSCAQVHKKEHWESLAVFLSTTSTARTSQHATNTTNQDWQPAGCARRPPNGSPGAGPEPARFGMPHVPECVSPVELAAADEILATESHRAYCVWTSPSPASGSQAWRRARWGIQTLWR